MLVFKYTIVTQKKRTHKLKYKKMLIIAKDKEEAILLLQINGHDVEETNIEEVKSGIFNLKTK